MVFCFSLSWTKIPVQNSLVVQIILYAFLFSQVLFSNSARIFCSRLMKTKITQNISFSAAMICMFVFLLLLLLPTKLTFVDNCVSFFVALVCERDLFRYVFCFRPFPKIEWRKVGKKWQ